MKGAAVHGDYRCGEAILVPLGALIAAPDSWWGCSSLTCGPASGWLGVASPLRAVGFWHKSFRPSVLTQKGAN